MLTAVTKTDPGKIRSNNEDLALWDPELCVLAIADGMGGHNAGEVASRLAIETLHAFLRERAGDGRNAPWPIDVDAAAPLVTRLLRTAVTLANRQVFRTSEERPECAGMGTTITAAVVEGAHVTLASVGDSRLYVFRGSTLEQVTRDDTLMGALSDVAGVDPEMLERHPMRHVLTNVLGRGTDVEMALSEIELADGHLLLLSSDGMHGAVPHDAIQAILGAEPDLERAADLLVRTALEADGRDNITLVLARYAAPEGLESTAP